MIERARTSNPQDALGDETGSQGDRQIRRNQLLPLRPPKQCSATATGRGIRLWVLDWDRTPSTPEPTSTVAYNVHWAALCDLSTAQGIANAFARSIVVATLPATGGEAQTLVVDEDRQQGYFFFTGADVEGAESEYTSPPRFVAGQGLSSAIPGLVQRFQISESGEERDGTMWSVLSCECLAPDPLGSFFATQLIFKDYPKLGDLTAFGRREYGGVGGGSIQWQMLLPVGRRSGRGTIDQCDPFNSVVIFTGPENCFTICQPGDYFEALGVMAQIKSIDSATQITLGVPGGGAVNWPGKFITGLSMADYDFIGNDRVYCRSLSQDGNGETDVSQLPFVDVLLDGNLSAPNAPILTGFMDGTTKISTLGMTNRLMVDQVLGTRVSGYKIYRYTGASGAFSNGVVKKTWPADHNATVGALQYDDTVFTTTEMEQNQIFSYWATAFNARDQESAPSNRVEIACRLDSSQDTAPDVTGRVGLKNLFYNAQLAGTAAGNVNGGADQNANQFTDGANLPGIAYGTGAQRDGTGRWKGYTNWYSTKTGGAAALATFLGDGSVKLPKPNSVGESVFVFSEIEAWDTAKGAQFIKITKNGIYVFSIYAKHNGVQPNGTFKLRIEQYDNNTLRDRVRRRYRDTDDVLKTNLVGGANDLLVTGDLLTASWQRFYGIFVMDSSFGTTKQIRMTIEFADATTGDVIVCRPMLNEGEELGAWTPDMGDPYVSWPVGADPPSGIGDGWGGRTGRIREP